MLSSAYPKILCICIRHICRKEFYFTHHYLQKKSILKDKDMKSLTSLTLPLFSHILALSPQENLQNPLEKPPIQEIMLDPRLPTVYMRKKIPSFEAKQVQAFDLDPRTEVSPEQLIQFDCNISISFQKVQENTLNILFIISYNLFHLMSIHHLIKILSQVRLLSLFLS